MAKYDKETVLGWFEDEPSKVKVKSIFQGLALAKKPLELEGTKTDIMKTVADKVAAGRKTIVNKNIIKAIKDAYKYDISEEEIVKAIKTLYKDKVNERYNKKMQELENQIAALKAKML